MKYGLLVVDMIYNKEQRDFQYFPKHNENGDTKVIFCIWGGKSLDDTPMRAFNSITFSNGHECVWYIEIKNKCYCYCKWRRGKWWDYAMFEEKFEVDENNKIVVRIKELVTNEEVVKYETKVKLSPM